MRAFVLTFVLLATPSAASAGAYGKISGDLGSPSPPPDCSKLTHINQEFPAWSRLQWALKVGGGSSFMVVPQLTWQVWGREGQCAGGGGFLGSRSWRRLSLGYSVDAAWRPGDSIDLRPALRVARATFDQGFMSVGSSWVPSFELALTAGPTFDPRWSGVAVGVSATATIITFELRYAARTEDRGHEVIALVGLADVHGLWSLGPAREYQYD